MFCYLEVICMNVFCIAQSRFTPEGIPTHAKLSKVQHKVKNKSVAFSYVTHSTLDQIRDYPPSIIHQSKTFGLLTSKQLPDRGVTLEDRVPRKQPVSSIFTPIKRCFRHAKNQHRLRKPLLSNILSPRLIQTRFRHETRRSLLYCPRGFRRCRCRCQP